MEFPLRQAVLAVVLAALPAMAQQKPVGESSSKPHAKSHEIASPDAGSITDGIYRNDSLNFSYKVPFGWVDRTAEMRAGSEPGKSVVLLSIFERPPEAPSEGINSAVVIAAENVSSYPGLKTAADYFGPLTELTTSKGFKVASEPHEFPVGAKQVVRGDFSKDQSSSSLRQTSLVFLQKNWIVSLTFLGTNDDEIDELLEKLSFAGAPSKGRSTK